jgi:hypothetical protein
MDPDLDPGGPKTRGSGGSGSEFGSASLFFLIFLHIFFVRHLPGGLYCRRPARSHARSAKPGRKTNANTPHPRQIRTLKFVHFQNIPREPEF